MKNFMFKNESQGLCVKIPESLNIHYSMYVWPCSVVLAQWVWYYQDQIKDKNILEIGAGTGLPSIVAAMTKQPLSVVLTDDSFRPECLQNAINSCNANNIVLSTNVQHKTCDTKQQPEVFVMGLTWGEISDDFLNLGQSNYPPYPDIILGSDCFFDQNLFDSVLFSVKHLLQGNDETSANSQFQRKFYTTFQERNNERKLLESYFKQWNLQCKEILLSSFDADKESIAGSNIPGSHIIRLLEISLQRDS